MRLEALEAIVAYHTGDLPAARARLEAARARLARLDAPPAALAALREMGYSRREAARALRFCGGDAGAAVTFIGEQREKQRARADERRRQRAWLAERTAYGKTDGGLYVDRALLEQLEPLGYERALAAEALRARGNDLQAALDVLTDPVRRGALQLAAVARQIKEQEQGPQDVDAGKVARLLEMGFGERDARLALKAAGGSFRRAVARLTGGGDEGGDGEGGEGGERGGRGGRGRGGGAHGSGSSSGADSTDSEGARLEAALVSAARGGGDDPMAAYDLDLRPEAEALARYAELIAAAERRAAAAATAAAGK